MVLNWIFGDPKPQNPWILEEPSDEVVNQGTVYGREESYYPELRKRLESQEAGASQDALGNIYQQNKLAQEYQDVLAGKKASLAEQQMRAGQAQAMQQAAQMAASARGGTAGLLMAQRSAQQQAALGGAGVARDAAMLRAKETAEARGQYGGLLTSMRSQAQQQQQAMLDAQMRASEADMAARSGLMREMYQNYRQAMSADAQREAAETQKKAQLQGSAIQAGAILAAPQLAPKG